MTRAMWFVWLLRSDIRDGASPLDAQAQRKFMSWWLLWAPAEYPAVFSRNRRHADIAMQLVALGNGLRCPRLLLTLHEARHDLQQAFPLDSASSLAEYFHWYQQHGSIELATAPLLPKSCLASCERTLLRSHAAQPSCTGTASPTETRRPKQVLAKEGVNLIGLVHRQSGLGEDVRMLSAAFAAVGVAHVVIDAEGNGSQRLRYATSVYCMSAFDAATLYLQHGRRFFSEQLRIGYWPWELPKFPDIWTDVYDLIDEIWTGSEFTARAYRANCPKPVICLPAPVTVPAVSGRSLPSVKNGAFVFTYPFDPNSYMARKNPIALVRAFRLAFPCHDEGSALLLRVNGKLSESPARRALLCEIGADHRITVVESTLDRTDVLTLTASCDCLVSPHRAEGFGRNIAEAILLNVPVLATGFSGCSDYLEPNEGLAFRLKEVEADEYPFSEGLLWADPDVADMAAKMKLVRARMRRTGRKAREQLVRRADRFSETYAPRVTGRRFVDRLADCGVIARLFRAYSGAKTGKKGDVTIAVSARP
jgi:glycosyltransferase involved in cell wall biosynthesis